MSDDARTQVLIEDYRDAATIATEAGRVLLELREQGLPPAGLKARGDARSEKFIAAALASRHGGDAALSEEAADDAARLRSSRVWIVDPLDGTREYSEVPRTDWAVHVALVVYRCRTARDRRRTDVWWSAPPEAWVVATLAT